MTLNAAAAHRLQKTPLQQITIRDNDSIRNKVAAFIITGGQNNIQAVVGQMLLFFGELGFDFPQFPFIAHSRGWDAEERIWRTTCASCKKAKR